MYSLGLLLLLGIALCSATPQKPPVQGPTTAVNPTIKGAPGWYPPADPESMSVIIGRRTSAKLVSEPFRGGTRTLDDMGRMVCRSIHHSSKDSLGLMCITQPEFSVILWPEFPQSRPITGLTADDGWFLLERRNLGGISRALADWGGQQLTFLRWERADTIGVYKNFKLHNGLRLVVRDERGGEQKLDIVRTIAERKGRFKLYSLHD